MTLGPPFRSDEEMKVRNERGNAILSAFQARQVLARYEPSPGTDHSWVITYFNFPGRRQRQVLVTIEDDGGCSIYLSHIYEVPEGKTGRDVALADIPRISQLPADTPKLIEQIVNITCQAAERQEG